MLAKFQVLAKFQFSYSQWLLYWTAQVYRSFSSSQKVVLDSSVPDQRQLFCKEPNHKLLYFFIWSLSQLLHSATVPQKQPRQYINDGCDCTPINSYLLKLAVCDLILPWSTKHSSRSQIRWLVNRWSFYNYAS